MIICPICHSKYEFQESLLGQRVSCECGCSWVLTMDQVEIKADDESEVKTDSQTEKYIYSDDDDLLQRAFELVINERRASTSYLQRRLNISYNEASNILFELEKRGVVSKPAVVGGQKREILLPKDGIFEDHMVGNNENREVFDSNTDTNYLFPHKNLLKTISYEKIEESPIEIDSYKQKIAKIFLGFNISIEFVRVDIGMQMIRFVIKLPSGTNINEFIDIQQGLDIGLGTKKIRYLLPIPTESYIGIEVPRKISDKVSLYSLISSSIWEKQKDNIPILLGTNIYQECSILDLEQARHIFILGENIEEVSTFLDMVMLSLLLKFRPDELKLLLIDTNKITLSKYSTIPHLLNPLVNDIKECSSIFEWISKEIDSRLSKLSANGCKNFSSYNERVSDRGLIEGENTLFYPIVIMCNDLTMNKEFISSSGIDANINKIIKLGHLVGIHLVLSTVSYADVSTILFRKKSMTKILFHLNKNIKYIKENCYPDTDKLNSNGDFLLYDYISIKENRFQSATIEDIELQSIIDFVSVQAFQSFIRDSYPSIKTSKELIIEKTAQNNESLASKSSKVFDSEVHIYPTDDDLILKAFCTVIEEKWATPTYLQRRLNIDYNLASNIIAIFEKRGIISEPVVDGSQRREILLTKEQIEYYLKIYENPNKEDSANNDFTDLNKKNKSTEETIEELNKKIVISYTNEIYGLLSNKPLFNLLDHGYMTFTNIMIKNLKKVKILEGPKDKEGNIYHVERIPSRKELENIIQCSFYQDQRKRDFWNSVKDNCYRYTFIIIAIVLMSLFGYAVYDDMTDENKIAIRKYEQTYGKESKIILEARSSVRRVLKSPSSAKFWRDDVAKRSTLLTDEFVKNKPYPKERTWQVFGTVEATNAFGAKLKKTYLVIVVYWGGNNYEAIHVEELP